MAALANKFGLYLSKVYRTADRVAQQFGSQFVRSWLMVSNTSTAEASSTTLLTFGCLAAFGNEFVSQ